MNAFASCKVSFFKPWNLSWMFSGSLLLKKKKKKNRETLKYCAQADAFPICLQALQSPKHPRLSLFDKNLN